MAQHKSFISSTDSVEDQWTKFGTIVQYVLDEYVPSKIVRDGKEPPWYNNRVRKLLRKQRELHSKHKNSQSLADKQKLHEAKCSVRGGYARGVQRIRK